MRHLTTLTKTETAPEYEPILQHCTKLHGNQFGSQKTNGTKKHNLCEGVETLIYNLKVEYPSVYVYTNMEKEEGCVITDRRLRWTEHSSLRRRESKYP